MTDQLTTDAPTTDSTSITDRIDDASEPTQEKTPRRSTRAKGRSGGRTAKPSIRRIAEKAEEVLDADPTTRQLVADLTGAASSGIADLTTAIMESKRTPVEAAVADLTVIQTGTVPEAVIHLVGMSKSELQALHQLVSAFSDITLPDKIPAKSTDAALVLVDPVRSAEVDQSAIDSLTRLLGK